MNSNPIFDMLETSSRSPKLAVLLLDMEELMTKDLAPYDLERLLGVQLEILRHCAKTDVPVFAFSLEMPGISHHWNIVEELQSDLNAVPRKWRLLRQGCNAFRHIDIVQYLRERSVDMVLITGIYADLCVFRTCEGAIDAGFRVITGDELTATERGIGPVSGEKLEWYKSNCIYNDDWRTLLGMSSSPVIRS